MHLTGNWSAQSYLPHNYNFDNGLASNHVYKAVQDNKGFIWFATDNGVSRFDGKTFINYGTTEGLPDNDIYDIATDSKGNIWLSCFNGSICYISKGVVYTPTNDSILEKVKPGRYTYFKVADTSSQKLYFVSSTDLYTINNSEKIEISLKKNMVVRSVGKNFFISATEHGLYRLYNNRFKALDSVPYQNSFIPGVWSPLDALKIIGPDMFGQLTAGNIFYRYIIKNNTIKLLDSIPCARRFFQIDYLNNKLWLYADVSGIIPVTNRLQADQSRDTLFKGIQVVSLMVDREQNYWACTLDKGVYVIANNSRRYLLFDEYCKGSILAKLCVDGDKLYMGSLHSDVLVKEGFQIKKLFNHQQVKGRNLMYGLVALGKNLLVITPDNVVVLDKQYNISHIISIDNVKALWKLNNDELLIGNHMGGFRYSMLQKKITETFFKKRVTSICVAANGEILCGSTNGLYKVSKKNGSYSDVPFLPQLLKDVRISTVKSNKDVIAVGTVQKGLVLVRGQDYEIVKISTEARNINCSEIFIDKTGNIWTAAYNGLFKISLQNGIHQYSVKKFTRANGLLSSYVTDVTGTDKHIYVASGNGITILNAEENKIVFDPPSVVYIDELFVNGKAMNVSGSAIELPYDSNQVELQFSVIDFKSLGNVEYQYRFINSGRDWQSSANNFLKLEALSPGIHKLEIRSKNYFSPEVSPSLLFTIIILPPWYQTIWFRIGFILVLISLTAFLVYSRQKKVRQQAHKEKLLKESELKALWGQMNPHFVFNSLNSIQDFILDHKPEEASDYLARFAGLMRMIIESSRKTFIPISREIDFLNTYVSLEELRFPGSFHFSVRLSENIDSETLIPSMIIQPVIENAIKYGLGKNRKTTEILLDIKPCDDFIMFKITDTGPGIGASKKKQKGFGNKHQPVGLTNIKERLLLLGNPPNRAINITDIKNSAGEIAGTEVSIYLKPQKYL